MSLDILLMTQIILLMSLIKNKLGWVSFIKAKNISHLSQKRKKSMLGREIKYAQIFDIPNMPFMILLYRLQLLFLQY